MTQKKELTSKRVAIIGNSPLPIENVKKNYAAGIRTWNFATAAKNNNCEVMIIGYRIPKSYQNIEEEIKFMEIEGINYYSVEGTKFEDKNWMLDKINNFNPDCIVGVNTFPASFVAELNLNIPFWADLNGSVMAEAQSKAHMYDDDKYVHHFFKMESKVLSRADIFSTVSESQGFSLIGELGIWGRLNKNTMGYRMVRVIPNTVENKLYNHKKNVIRNVLAKDSDFVIFSSGGYNTWTDVDTLFQGLEKAMDQNPNLVFVSTGGEIFGHDDLTYAHFQDLIKSSKHKEKFHLCGWVSYEDLPNYYIESDLGINSDKYSYEAILGARTRVLDWLRASLTFISTPLSEVTNYLIRNNLAYGFKQGDSDDLAEKLLHIASHRDELEKIKSKLKQILPEEFTAEHSFKEFREWLKNPSFSPDHGRILELVSKNGKTPQPSIPKAPLKESIAISSWPKVSKVLKTFHLSKYEDSVKQFGTNIISKTPQKIYRAKFLKVDLPEMNENGKYIIPVKIKNDGNVVWQNYQENVNAVNLSYIWKDTEGKIVMKNEERTSFPKSIKPGKKISLDAMITAPPNAGEYVLEIDLVKEREFWFSEVDSKPFSARINVKKNQGITTTFPKVSVIVVSYNSEAYITQCIESLLQSNYPKLEIIVVDNASSDNSIKELKKYQNKIKLISNQENIGFAGGNNLGIKNSTGEIIVLINPDAYVTSNSIRELVLPLLLDKKIMITGPKIYYPRTTKIQSAGGIINKNALPRHLGYGQEDSYQFDYPREVDYVTGAAMAIKRKLFEITGVFDTLYHPVYYEETDKCFAARKLGYKVQYVPTSIVYHHESTTLAVHSKKFLKHFHSSRFKYIYKNYNFGEFMSFIFYEIKWFLFHCGSEEKSIVAKAHLKSMFSPGIKFRKKIPI